MNFTAADAKERPSKKFRFGAGAGVAGATVQPQFNASCSSIDVPADSWALLSSPCAWNNCGVYCIDGVPANYESLSLPSIHGADGARPPPSAAVANSRLPAAGAALSVVDMCLLWNSARFVLQPEGQGDSMPPLEVVFIGHGAAATAAAASCAAFTRWACASIGTTLHTHTVLTAPCNSMPRSLREYLRANGASNLFIRLGDVPAKSSSDRLTLGAQSTVEVDSKTLRARSLAADAAYDNVLNGSDKAGTCGSKTGGELLRKSIAQCCIQQHSCHT